jgi:hypothetical protein
VSLPATVAAVIALAAGGDPTCDPGAANCATAGGRIVLVESIDPDGDGDAHLVLAGSGDVTAPGISSIDVERALRPQPLPGVGDYLRAAGPVYTGSFGQRQIQATALRVVRTTRRR